MSFPYDQDQTNQALQTLGSSYQLPAAQQPAAQPAPQQPAPAPVAQAKDPEVPGMQKDGGSAGGGANMAGAMGTAQGAASGLGAMTDDPEKKSGMDKLGGLIGTVLAAYTGNYAGAASSMSQMKDK